MTDADLTSPGHGDPATAPVPRTADGVDYGPHVVVERDGHVLLIGINRPEKRNAWNLDVITGVARAYETLGRDPELRVGVVHGYGDHFSAGLDLAEVGPAVAEKGPQALSGHFEFDPFGVFGTPVPKPVVVALQGISYTLAIELALASDIVVVAEDVRMRQLEIGRGIIPFGGATLRATGSLGWGNAMRFLLTADEFGAAEAMRIGLAQEVVPVGDQLDTALRIARTIAAQAPLAVQATLANARVAKLEGHGPAVAHLRETLPGIMTSQDAAEGLMSFVERREARFRGK